MPEVKDPTILQQLNGSPTAYPSAPQAPGVIRGTPKTVAPPTALQIEANERANRADARAAETAARAAEKDRQGSVEQGKAASFLARGIQANKDFEALGNVGPRSLPGQMVADNFPNVANYMSDAERQSADQAERTFIAAILRYDSGAAIPPSEFVTNGQIYFPRPGDTPEVLEQKRRSREVALQGLFQAAGPAAKDLLEQPEQDGITGSITYTGPNEDDGLTGTVTDDSPNRPPDNRGFLGYNSFSDAARDVGMGLGDVISGAANSTIGLIANPVGQLIYDATGYGDQTYDTGQILRDGLGLPQSDPTSLATKVNEFGAGSLAGGSLARAGSNVFTGLAGDVAQTLGRTPLRDTVAGAAAGAGSYLGGESGIPGGEYAGALLGGMAGYGAANRATNALLPRSPGPVGVAMQRQQVDLLPADVGGPATRGLTTGAKASPISAGPVVRQAQENTRQLGSAARRAAEGQGSVPDTGIAGDNVRRAAIQYSKDTSATGSRLYKKAEDLARGVRVKPLQTIAAVDEQLARLQADPSASAKAVQELQGFKEALEGGVGVTGLRDARTRLSEGVYDGSLRSSTEQRMWQGILANLSSDMELGLQNAGRTQAARTFKRADEFWKARVEHIDQVLDPIVGKEGIKGGEQIIDSIESMARGKLGGNKRLSRLIGVMSPEDAGQVRATIVDRLGKATPGGQDAAGSVFAPSTFLTNWNKMTPQAKEALFGNGRLREDLNDIALLAENMKATRAMENHSNTGVAVGANLVAGGALMAAHPVGILLGAGAQYATGKLLASPGFARLLARAAKQSPEAANRTFSEQLGVLATKEPLIANDLRAVQQALTNAANDNVGVRASASDREEDNPQ